MIIPNYLCLGNISKEFSASNIKKTGFNNYIYDVSLDYDSIDVDDILDIHKYLTKRMTQCNKLFGFVKRVFVSAMMFFGCSLYSVNTLECVSINNQECKVRPEIFHVNSNQPVFYPFCIRTSKWSGSCNNISDSYAKLCVPDVIKN